MYTCIFDVEHLNGEGLMVYVKCDEGEEELKNEPQVSGLCV